jgi:hydrogenase maturation protein HypF
MLQRTINCPASSAAGRWFDAAAGLLGLSVRQAFEAQAAIALEQAANRWLQAHPMEVRPADWRATPNGQIDLRPLVVSTLATVNLNDPEAVDEAAARFHLTLAEALASQTIRLAQTLGLREVVLGGGCFFNRILTQRLTTLLACAGLKVWGASAISCGDAGLALGQAWVAAQYLKYRAGELPAPKENLCV